MYRTPGRGAYAKPEIERRFVVSGQVPHSSQAPREIQDLYLDGLRLRLRRVNCDGAAAFKLTQKVRPVPDDPRQVSITNIYLDQGEYDRLRRLPGHRLTKTRTLVNDGNLLWSVDHFHGRLAGLVTSEVELTSSETKVSLPTWLGSEVTHDDLYSGGRLAQATDIEIALLLAV